MKLIVAGSRDLHCRERVYEMLNRRIMDTTMILSGMALHWLWDRDPDIGGPDRYAYEWAKEVGIAVRPFYADWKSGPRAGFIRNADMADYGDALLYFWDYKSSGTKDMIKQMVLRKKPHYDGCIERLEGLFE